MGTDDVKVTAMNMYKYKERLRFFKPQPLSLLINNSPENYVYPSKLKLANVIPTNDDESDPSNYRPISLLSVFNRIFETKDYVLPSQIFS